MKVKKFHIWQRFTVDGDDRGLCVVLHLQSHLTKGGGAS